MSAVSISCIIPVYNGQKYLAQAIDSVLAQTCAAVQVIVVNDGSTDHTDAVIEQYGDRVESLHQSNAGVSVARNRGVEASGGELISFLDADDRLHPEKLARQLAAFADQDELELCDSCSEYFWSEELTQEQLDAEVRYHQAYWKQRLPGHISTWLLRRELFERVGGFQPGMRFSEDIDWRTRAADAQAREYRLDEVLSYRRIHQDNVTARDRAQQLEGLADTMKAHLDRLRKGA